MAPLGNSSASLARSAVAADALRKRTLDLQHPMPAVCDVMLRAAIFAQGPLNGHPPVPFQFT
jgi:hypothetical protein